jgi:RND family efflux transporter MFP subunit
LSEVPSAEVPLNIIPAVMQAASRKENAAKRLERIRPLVAARTVTVEEGDDAENEFRVAEAEHANQLLIARTGLANIKLKQSSLAMAEQQLVDSQVLAPTPTQAVPGTTNGVGYSVTSRTVSEGSFVRPGTEICKLVITETLKLRVPVPEAYTAEVRLGQKVDVMLAAYPAPSIGAVTRINPAVDAATRTFEVEIQVPNPKGQLKPGSFAKVNILTRMDAQAVTVPLSALVNFAGINKLFVAENGRAKEVQITTGVQTNDWVEITTPRIDRGAQVITSGQTLLAAESPISIRASLNVAQKTQQLP